MAAVGDLVIKVRADTRQATKALSKFRRKLEWTTERIAWIAIALGALSIGISVTSIVLTCAGRL